MKVHWLTTTSPYISMGGNAINWILAAVCTVAKNIHKYFKKTCDCLLDANLLASSCKLVPHISVANQEAFKSSYAFCVIMRITSGVNFLLPKYKTYIYAKKCVFSKSVTFEQILYLLNSLNILLQKTDVAMKFESH